MILRLDDGGCYTLLRGERELVRGLNAHQAQRFAESLGGLVESGEHEHDAVQIKP